MRLRAAILEALADGEPRYGLTIKDTIRTNGRWRWWWGLGSLYPVLYRLEEEGLIEGYWGETTASRLGARRRYYRRKQ